MPGAVFAEGDSVTLRTIEEEDLDFLQRWRNHPDVRVPLTDSNPRNGEQMQEYFENRISDEGDGFGFLVCSNDREAAADRAELDVDPGEPVPVGAIHMPWIRQPHGSGMVMYWIAPPHQGNGYVTEATELMLDYAFEERRIAKARAVVLDNNPGSRHVLEKLGFAHEGTQREEVFVDGERRDMHRYGLLAREWLDESDA